MKRDFLLRNHFFGRLRQDQMLKKCLWMGEGILNGLGQFYVSWNHKNSSGEICQNFLEIFLLEFNKKNYFEVM